MNLMKTLPTLDLTVDPQWIDEYGHMNAAHYVGVFDRHGFELLKAFGVGLDYTAESNCGIYTMRIDVNYLREVVIGDPLRLSARVLEADDKRLLCLLELWQTRGNYLAATMEQLSLHVDLGARRATAFPLNLASRLAQLAQEHSQYPLPFGYRRSLSLVGFGQRPAMRSPSGRDG